MPFSSVLALRKRWGQRLLGLALIILFGMGCDSLRSPTDAPKKYDQLVRQALAQAEAHPDTSFFWLRNTRNARARSLMLELGADYLRYDRAADVLCVWTGEGLWPARGYVTAPVSGTVPADSVGRLCNIEGSCTVESFTHRWSRFRCD